MLRTRFTPIIERPTGPVPPPMAGPKCKAGSSNTDYDFAPADSVCCGVFVSTPMTMMHPVTRAHFARSLFFVPVSVTSAGARRS